MAEWFRGYWEREWVADVDIGSVESARGRFPGRRRVREDVFPAGGDRPVRLLRRVTEGKLGGRGTGWEMQVAAVGLELRIE